MCGIVGYVGTQEATLILLAGLRRVEYRVSDSGGHRGRRPRRPARPQAGPGRSGSSRRGSAEAPKGRLGIGHTRWATRGEPNDVNAHPHTDCRLPSRGRAQRHHRERRRARARLVAGGHTFRSTSPMAGARPPDRRGIAEGLRSRPPCARRGVRNVAESPRSTGNHRIGSSPRRNGSPIVLGIGDREMLVARTSPRSVRHTQKGGAPRRPRDGDHRGGRIPDDPRRRAPDRQADAHRRLERRGLGQGRSRALHDQEILSSRRLGACALGKARRALRHRRISAASRSARATSSRSAASRSSAAAPRRTTRDLGCPHDRGADAHSRRCRAGVGVPRTGTR